MNLSISDCVVRCKFCPFRQIGSFRQYHTVVQLVLYRVKRVEPRKFLTACMSILDYRQRHGHGSLMVSVETDTDLTSIESGECVSSPLCLTYREGSERSIQCRWAAKDLRMQWRTCFSPNLPPESAIVVIPVEIEAFVRSFYRQLFCIKSVTAVAFSLNDIHLAVDNAKLDVVRQDIDAQVGLKMVLCCFVN